MKMRKICLILAAATLVLSACSKSTPTPAETTEATPAATTTATVSAEPVKDTKKHDISLFFYTWGSST
jgi:ABC-type glycerol-3-phosphate transport system substrate-binding protein